MTRFCQTWVPVLYSNEKTSLPKNISVIFFWFISVPEGTGTIM